MKKQSNLTATYPTLPELTFRGMFLGMLITVIFTASNVYLGLKVGLTFSSSIPAAVISMAILRMFKNSNILENNMVQTQASARALYQLLSLSFPACSCLDTGRDFRSGRHCFSAPAAVRWAYCSPFPFAGPWSSIAIFPIRKAGRLQKS